MSDLDADLYGGMYATEMILATADHLLRPLWQR